ncbi:NUDIX domain-containing protein [Galbibacter sp. BG1]
MADYNYGVYIGRFQPLHIGHEHVIREALSKVETLILIVGSAFQARTPVNPFTFNERKEMIRNVFRHEVVTGRLIILPLRDYQPDARWANELRRTVNETVLDHLSGRGIRNHGLRDATIALTGYGKDASSYYLDMFPEWHSVQLTSQHGTINASDIRIDYLRRLPRLPHDAVPARILPWMKEFTFSDSFKDLVTEVDTYQRNREEYGTGPFLAADALVVHRGKILLVTRGKAIGRGLLATPGGFVESGETMLEAAKRELKEETGLDLSAIEHNLASQELADNPSRSLRGRVVSMMYMFVIPNHVDLPAVAGGDDAAHADWYYLDDLRSDQFFEDHFTLISNLL